MSCTDAADWKSWVAETLALRTNQSGKGLHVQHLLSASIHFTSAQCRAEFIHKIGFLRRKEFFFLIEGCSCSFSYLHGEVYGFK